MTKITDDEETEVTCPECGNNTFKILEKSYMNGCHLEYSYSKICLKCKDKTWLA